MPILTESPRPTLLCHPARSYCFAKRGNGVVEGPAFAKQHRGVRCPSVSKFSALLFGVVIFALLSLKSALACSDSPFPSKVGRHFSVQVLDRDKPVEGLQIRLSTVPKRNEDSRTILVVKTDPKGTAEFKGLSPKLYYLGIKHPAFGTSIIVEVMRHPPHGSNIVAFQWPGWNPLSTQTVAGSLTGRARTNRPAIIDMTSTPVYSSVPGAKLTLSKAVSGELVGSQITQEAGKFEFKDIPAGFYMLRVETPVFNPVHWIYPSDGYVPVEVDPSSRFSTVNLQLDNAICGELAWGRPKETVH